MTDENKKKQVKRKFISLEEKVQILDRLKTGERIVSLGLSLNLSEATIRTIKKDEHKIRKSVAEGCSFGANRVNRIRDIDIIRMENVLMIWFEDCIKKRIPVNGNAIRKKAIKIYNHLKQIGDPSTEQQSQSFIASKGWFENLKKRFSLHNIDNQGEEASTNAETATKFIQELHEIVDKGEYNARQIFNADEMTLYWKKMPSRTYLSKNEKHVRGYKSSKDRIRLLICNNVAGTFMLKPMVISRFSRPRAMKNKDMSQLPVFWQSNNKAWMDKSIFEDWFNNYFVPSVESYMKEENLSFRALLLVDYAIGYNKELNHPNVKIVSFPPHCALLIQPLDQGVIHSFKAHYIRQIFGTLFNRLKNDNSKTLIQIWKEFSMLDSVNIISSACKEIRTSTFNAVWRTLLPQMVKEENVIPPVDEEYARIINTASRLGGEGFEDMTIEDVKEMFKEESLSEEELMEFIDKSTSNAFIVENLKNMNARSFRNLNSNDIQTGMDLSEQLKLYFVEKDPLAVRSRKFKRELQRCLLPYQELLMALQSDNTVQSDILVPTTNSI